MYLQIRSLGCNGGKDLADTTRRILWQVFHNNLARELNFAGRGEKTGIGDMAITNVISKWDLLYCCTCCSTV